MTPRTSSFIWFLAHDLRLSIRAFDAQFRGLSRLRIIAIFFGAVALTHALAWPVARHLQLVVREPRGREHIEIWVAAGVVVSLCMILAQAMVSAMRMLYARADFELLFAAPVSATVVLGSRVLAVALRPRRRPPWFCCRSLTSLPCSIGRLGLQSIRGCSPRRWAARAWAWSLHWRSSSPLALGGRASICK